MKKLLSIIIVLSMVLPFSASAVEATEGQTVQWMSADAVINFPDEVLREYMISKFDKNGDDQIQQSEITFGNETVSIDLAYKHVKDTTGLECIIFNVTSYACLRFNFRDSEVKNIVPLFECLVRNPNVRCYMNLSGTMIEDSDLAKIPTPAKLPTNLYAGLSLTIDDTSQLHDYSPLSKNYAIDELSMRRNVVSTGMDCRYITNVSHTTGSLDAEGTTGEGFYQMLQQPPDVVRISGDAVQYVSKTYGMRYLYIVDNFSDDDLRSFADTGSVRFIGFIKTQVTDITPVKNLFVKELRFEGPSNGLIPNVGGKNIGDCILEQAVEIPSIKELSFSRSGVTDLTPLQNNSNIEKYSFDDECIALAYKNNKIIYDELKSKIKFLRTYPSADVEIFEYPDGTKLSFQASSNKMSYANGDVITNTITLTNEGTTHANFDLAFFIQDNYWDLIDVKNGDRNQAVTNLAPGESIRKTISFETNNYKLSRLESDVIIRVGQSAVKKHISSLAQRVVYLSTSGFIRTRNMHVSGICAPDMAKVQIKTSDDELVADIYNYAGTTSFSSDIQIPEKYWPEVGGTNKINIKAVIVDKNGKEMSSAIKTVQITNPDENNTLDLKDCHYMKDGSSHQYNELDPSNIYYDSRIIVRTKVIGVEQNDISSVQAIINQKTYDMTLCNNGGRNNGFYRVLSDNLTSSEYFDIIIRVTTKSGETLEKLVGYGRMLIDPSGIITDQNGRTIEGVKVTLQKLQKDGTWESWDAENYSQENPMYTNENGYYGWDVPEGTYRIIAEKEGYVTKVVERYYSRDQGEETEITVLPPRMDVDFSMEYADPENPPVKPMTDEEAKKALEAAILGLKLSASADETDVISKLMESLTENMYVSFKSGTYTKSESTDTTEGSITGTLILENIWKDETQEITVNIPLEINKSTESVDVLDNFTDKLMIEKIYGDNENVNLEISSKNNSDLPELKLYKALYTSEGILKKVDIVNAESVNGKTVISIEKPIVGENEIFKLMLWTNEQIPVIEVIHNDTVGFFK